MAELKPMRDENQERKAWTEPKLDVLEISETAGGNAGNPDGKAGAS